MQFTRWRIDRGRCQRSIIDQKIIDTYLPRGKEGNVLCRYCQKETLNKYQTFCNSICIHKYKLSTQPHYLRFQVYLRDQGICQQCKLNSHELYLKFSNCKTLFERRSFLLKLNSTIQKRVKLCLKNMKTLPKSGMFWEVAHIIDVQDGGCTNLKNVRTLCVHCHYLETYYQSKILKSNLKIDNKIKNLFQGKRKRERKPFIIEEEHALLNGLIQFQTNWSLLKKNQPIFNDRTPEELRWKARNMIKKIELDPKLVWYLIKAVENFGLDFNFIKQWDQKNDNILKSWCKGTLALVYFMAGLVI